ncbi:unannotated protein [freshwater metagenome]|uniref:Unannotated protein n=1 Tax=freshwater metagenome TaxID=449393 RepID=A0A6J6CD58_9ZZZZ
MPPHLRRTIVSVNPPTHLSRRKFFGLSAAVGAGAFLAACGGSSSPTGNSFGKVNKSHQLVKRFPPTGMVPGKVRLPISLADATGLLGSDKMSSLPPTLTASVTNMDTGQEVIAYTTADMHATNMSIPYWPFVIDITEVGLYTLTVNEAPSSEMSFQIFERSMVAMPLVGDPLPAFDTPTLSDTRGVDPLCTRPDAPCPFHDITLTEALASGKPVVYMIGTPAYCKTGTCAPGLDALIDVASSVGDRAAFVHADVYTDRTTTVVAPAVTAYSLDFEPVLYIANAQGVLVNRLDAVFDVDEIRDALAAEGIS